MASNAATRRALEEMAEQYRGKADEQDRQQKPFMRPDKKTGSDRACKRCVSLRS